MAIKYLKIVYIFMNCKIASFSKHSCHSNLECMESFGDTSLPVHTHTVLDARNDATTEMPFNEEILLISI